MTSPPADWFQIYQTDLIGLGAPAAGTLAGNQLSDATVVSTTIGSPTTPINHLQTTGASTSPRFPHLNPDGRVSKPIRRRSRASRRTPTTLLNTDATNFRAMVQQFTGGPAAAFSPSPGLNILGSNSAAGFQNPGSGNYQIDFQQTQTPHHLNFPRQPQRYMFPGNYINAPEDGFINSQMGASSTSSSTENNKNNNTRSFMF